MAFSPTLDLNTSGLVVDGIQPGQAWAPPRYTTTAVDTVRVLAFSKLRTEENAYALNQPSGLDWLTLLDSRTSDAERSAIVSEAVLSLPGVTGLVADPTIIVGDGRVTVTFTARVSDATFTLTLGA